MRKFAALSAAITATALVSSMAFAKPVIQKASAPKAQAKAATSSTVQKSEKREIPSRGPKGRFLPRHK